MSIEVILIALIGVIIAVAAVLLLANLRRIAAQTASAGDGEKRALRESFERELGMRDDRIAELKHEVDEQRQRYHALSNERLELQGRYEAMGARMSEQARQNEENLRRFAAARQQMTDEFKAIAGDVLKSHGDTFSKQNKDQVELLLKPLGERIEVFTKGLTEDRAELVQQLKTLHENSLSMTQEATNLTRALKGNSQTQGAWGEMILTNILERSGLRKGEQFRYPEYACRRRRWSGAHRRGSDVHAQRRQHHHRLESVAHLVRKLCECVETTRRRDLGLKGHVASVRGHIKTLASKDYQRHANSGFDSS